MDFNKVSGQIPSLLVKFRRNIPESDFFDDQHFNQHFDTLSQYKVRVTIFESDGKVIYDNYNGKTATDIVNNYYSSPTTQNNHMARLETQVAIDSNSGCNIRYSSTIQGKQFYYWSKFVNSGTTIRCARLALELN